MNTFASHYRANDDDEQTQHVFLQTQIQFPFDTFSLFSQLLLLASSDAAGRGGGCHGNHSRRTKYPWRERLVAELLQSV